MDDMFVDSGPAKIVHSTAIVQGQDISNRKRDLAQFHSNAMIKQLFCFSPLRL